MNNFFKIFFASLLALIVFSVVAFFIFLGVVTALASRDIVKTGPKAVLLIDLSQAYPEISQPNPLALIGNSEQYDIPSLYDVVRLIHRASQDSAIKGIYIQCGSNNNGFAASEEIRNAIAAFKKSKKFVYASADVITQRAYQVANIADKIYCNPKGGVDWRGFALSLAFVKGTLEKLEIHPQIFYAGKFKSATEPFREYKMTDANRLQSTELLNELYNNFLLGSAQARSTDTAALHRYANEHTIRFASDALKYNLVDGLKYDDEIKEEIKQMLKIDKYDKLNLIPLGKYASATEYKERGTDKIAVIYAEGDIIDGKGEREQIGSESYRNLIRKARLDKTIKAIVIRINSGGGSALASENIWRELTLARKDKPLVVSFGDVAASGAYYLSCNADSIFAQPNTITGSIGVFSLLPDMHDFFNHKLGVTFDGVKTAPDADIFSVAKPLTAAQQQYIQNQVDTIYHDFKSRVAEGRHKTIEYIDSIAQGRVWSGSRALQLGLIDRIGGLKDAIASAAHLAKVSDYRLREYPEPQNFLDLILGNFQQRSKTNAIKEELGAEGIRTYNTIKKVKQMVSVTQARLPFDFTIE